MQSLKAKQKMTRPERCSMRRERGWRRKQENIELNELRQETSHKVTGLRSRVRLKQITAEELKVELAKFPWLHPAAKVWYERRIKSL